MERQQSGYNISAHDIKEQDVILEVEVSFLKPGI
jgi:hypothetical protein